MAGAPATVCELALISASKRASSDSRSAIAESGLVIGWLDRQEHPVAATEHAESTNVEQAPLVDDAGCDHTTMFTSLLHAPKKNINRLS